MHVAPFSDARDVPRRRHRPDSMQCIAKCMGNAQQHLESSCQACANGISFVDCVCTTPNGRALSVIDIMAEETLGVVRQPPQAARVMIPPTQSLPHVSMRRRLDADPGFYQRSPAPLSLSPPPEETTSDPARDAAPAATPKRVLVPAPRSTSLLFIGRSLQLIGLLDPLFHRFQRLRTSWSGQRRGQGCRSASF